MRTIIFTIAAILACYRIIWSASQVCEEISHNRHRTITCRLTSLHTFPAVMIFFFYTGIIIFAFFRPLIALRVESLVFMIPNMAAIFGILQQDGKLPIVTILQIPLFVVPVIFAFIIKL